ncbi:MAG TPA: sigma-70 family RNA polymerase sigma factor, partial [Anaeromyxobacteraceae bacterium]|nr:sigma-70 family RNA polymerase sigma factor [Anaeromyxobacteraceae bacterium]
DPDDLPGGAATPEEAAEGAALSRAVEALLGSLPDKQRAAFVLCRFEGLSYEEIARALDTSVSAVKSLVHRATVRAAAALAPLATLPLRKEALP